MSSSSSDSRWSENEYILSISKNECNLRIQIGYKVKDKCNVQNTIKQFSWIIVPGNLRIIVPGNKLVNRLHRI